jgi:hypothetical protein
LSRSMEPVERWWTGDVRERYWLEVSARGADVGVDLNAPTTNEVGGSFWSYDLLREVGDGDVVLHYDRDVRAIVAWSWAVGSAWPDLVVWAARGTFARARAIQPHERPGVRVSLRGPFRLEAPLTLERIRQEQSRLGAIRSGRPYFPFELGSRATRPMQGYLFKLPLDFIELFPELEEVPRLDGNGQSVVSEYEEPTVVGPSDSVDRPAFVPKNEGIRSREARPWSRDPSEVDRALSAHARVERLVADAAAAEGWFARGYGRLDPVFDLLLERDAHESPVVVVEVKSTTATNEEKQLRLALGQVLRYRQLLRARTSNVVALIAVEAPPRDATWIELCANVEVSLVWPATVGEALRALDYRKLELRTAAEGRDRWSEKDRGGR